MRDRARMLSAHASPSTAAPHVHPSHLLYVHTLRPEAFRALEPRVSLAQAEDEGYEKTQVDIGWTSGLNPAIRRSLTKGSYMGMVMSGEQPSAAVSPAKMPERPRSMAVQSDPWAEQK